MSHWMIDLRKTAVKKWAKYASDVTLVLFSKNKKKLKQARQLPSAEVCDVSGKKYGKTMLKHIKAYVRNHPEATLWVFTRNKKLRKRCQKWQARHPEVQLWVLKKLPSELPVEAETPVVEANEVVAETVVVAETQADNETPAAEAETPVVETHEVVVETAVAAEAQADNETPTTEAETPVLEANEVEAETAVVAETPTPEHEETLVFTMETEVFAETAPVNSAVLEAQAVIKKNKPKKKQQLIHLLAQTLRLETAVAQDLVQQLQAAGNITIDAAENIKYCS